MSCAKITKNLNPTCANTKKRGGLSARFLIGFTEDVETITFGAGNQVTDLTLKAGKSLYSLKGKREQNDGSKDAEFGNSVTLRNQVLNLVLYASTAEELATVDEVLDSEDMFIIVENNNKQFEVYGIAKNENVENYGLNPSAFSHAIGKLQNDDNGYKVTFSGKLPNIELLFEQTDYETDKTALEAMVYDPGAAV